MGPRYVKILGKNHSKCMTEFIQDSWHKECYLNVKFVCKDSGSLSRGTLFANKAVLAAGSKTLYQLLSDTGDEDVTILVPESDFHTIKMLLQYIYTGQVLVDSILDELKSLILDWDVVYPQITSVGTTKKSKQTPSNEDPLSLDTFDQNNRRFVEEDVFVNPSRCDTSSFEDNFISLSAPIDKSQDGVTKDGKSAVETETNSGSVVDQQIEKKKRVRRKRDVDEIQPDSNAEDDMEEDKVDWLLTQTFLKKEKNRTLQLNATITDLKGAIQRHQLYMKHFQGVDPHSLPYKKAQRAPVKIKRIPCVICGKVVNSFTMKFHMESVHNNGERPYLCEQCGASFALKGALRTHVRNIHGSGNNRPHICTVCNKGFKVRTALKLHMTIHTGEKPFQCTYCDKNFRTRVVLVKHERTHTGEKPFGPCEFCGLWFRYRFSYVNHLRTHPRKLSGISNNAVDPETKLLKCSTCGLTFKREYTFLIHEATHKNEDPKLPCLHCPDTFPSMKLLNEHSRTEHPEKYYRCDQCPSFFVKKHNLDVHMLSHSNQDGKFPCIECGKEFSTKLKLNTHVKSHSSVFQCQFCSKQLTTKPSLVDHERIHTGERPFACPQCPKSFRMKAHLENHIRIHTGEKPFVCIHCGKAFSAKHNMDTHMKLHTGKKNECSKCGETFRSLVKLQQHQQIHDEEEEEERDSDSATDDDEDE